MKLSCTLLVTLAACPSATAVGIGSVGTNNLVSVQQATAAKKHDLDGSSGGGGGGAAAAAPKKVSLPENLARGASNQEVLETCSDEDEFTLEGYPDSSFDGCYSTVVALAAAFDGRPSFSLCGEAEDGLYFFAKGKDENSDNYFWAISEGTLNNDGKMDFTVVCDDAEENAAPDTHPTLVAAWRCSENAESSTATTDPPFSLTCGCPEEICIDEVATDDTDASTNTGSTIAAAGRFTANSVFFSATAVKVIVGLMASILGSVMFL